MRLISKTMTFLIAFTMCSISPSKVPSKFGRVHLSWLVANIVVAYGQTTA
jgi:hypothetical protein